MNENKGRESKGRGGKRVGAGRPKGTGNRDVINISNDVKNDIFRELKLRVEDGQRSFSELLVDMVYNRNTAPSLRIAALKLVADSVMIKEEKSTQDINQNAVVILPEIIKPE